MVSESEGGDSANLLRQPVGTEAWQDELSAQLSVMAEQGERSEAVMKLAPADLGELEIRLELRGNDATLQFGAASSEARQALELAQARLRELLTSQGIQVSEFSVFSNLRDKHPSESRGDSRQLPPREASHSVSLEISSDPRSTTGVRRSLGIVDLYA